MQPQVAFSNNLIFEWTNSDSPGTNVEVQYPITLTKVYTIVNGGVAHNADISGYNAVNSFVVHVAKSLQAYYTNKLIIRYFGTGPVLLFIVGVQ